MPWRTKVIKIFQLRHTLVGGAVETIFFPRGQASRLYNFNIQFPIHTKLLVSVEGVSPNTSQHQYLVCHFDFGRHVEILTIFVLKLSPPTDVTPPTSKSLSSILWPWRWKVIKIFILRHTCWPQWSGQFESFAVKHRVLITSSYNVLSRPNLSGMQRESPWWDLCSHGAWPWRVGSVAPPIVMPRLLLVT